MLHGIIAHSFARLREIRRDKNGTAMDKYEGAVTKWIYMRVLVLGGTGFMGRRLVDYLLRENCDVTIASSGKSRNPFEGDVASIVFDRFDIKSMADKLSSPPYFDVVFDQIGFGPDDVEKTVEIFRDRIGRYVYVSSAAVYSGMQGGRKESDFDPRKEELHGGSIETLGYSEGKRQAEAYLFQKAPFPVAAARFPVVIGHDDSTLRFQDHVNRVNAGESFVLAEKCGKRTYIWVDDAGRFLAWLGLQGKTGAYNAASPYSLDARELIGKIGKALGKEPVIEVSGNAGGNSSYCGSGDATLSVEKAQDEGFNFTGLDEWLPKEARLTLEKGGESPNSAEYFMKRLSGTSQ